MHIIKSAKKLSQYLNGIRLEQKNVTIGLVPTMGALHEGHTSLIEASVADNAITVCSIFVNPTQFGDKSDLEKYPKPIEKDVAILMDHNCSVLFLPEYDDVYPKEYVHRTFNLSDLDHKIEGASRPGHFQGVCNVVARLFEIVRPHKAYFGQKDFQQTIVIRRLIDQLNLSLDMVVVPIKREPHGLAMSSRNIRLSEKGRNNAAFIYRALIQLKEDVAEMGLQDALAKAKQFVSAQKGARIDYLVAVNANTLDVVGQLEEAESVSVLTVVEYEGVRLLDNIILK
ncbi:MAG: Pantothenate synthetase [Bacteroidota bacterium]|jgi:pantoate--beta-alanine ligase